MFQMMDKSQFYAKTLVYLGLSTHEYHQRAKLFNFLSTRINLHRQKTCTNKIVPDQLAPWEQADQGLYVCILQKVIN